MCYQDARGHESSDPHTRGDDHHYSRVDPAHEITRIRQSLAALEAHIYPNQAQRASTSTRRPSEVPNPIVPKKECIDYDISADKDSAAPGMLGSQDQGGLYAGPTSAATHLLIESRGDSDDSDSRQQSQDRLNEESNLTNTHITQEHDRDLLQLLPPLETIDGLIGFYFEYCNWIYRHVNQVTFLQQWDRYKTGNTADRIVLSTASVIMAIATHYLPKQHPLLEKVLDTPGDFGARLFDVSTSALKRHSAESQRPYTLEYVELLLVRTHYYSLAKKEGEEVWHIKGELFTIATAMGLHRDPGKWKMNRDLAERRRWAWWHIILLERWQAFLFGRPIAIASHHFDTQLPSYCDPNLDKTGRLYLPNIALFKLAFILGDIMDDAVSIRPIPYENVQANDRALTQWMDSLPPELNMDDFRVARSLASPNIAIRRLGVQSVIIRTSYYHIRFTLHRPYASASTNPSNKHPPTIDPAKSAESLEIAVSAADKLIAMVGQTRPDFLANSSLAVPGHMNWQPFHCFSAAMFFSFQLIANPDQPGAGLFRASIAKAITTLQQARGVPVADKGLDILEALCPLYAQEFPLESPESRDKKRSQILGIVRKLAFPYHDSHDPRRLVDSPSARGNMTSPANSNSVSPPMNSLPTLPPHPTYPDSQHNGMHANNSLRHAATALYPVQQQHQHQYQHQQHQQHQQHPQHTMAHPHSASVHSPQDQTQVVSPVHPHQNMTPTQNYTTPVYPISPQQPHQVYADHRYTSYVHPVDENMWGAAVGFGQAEWTQFLDNTRPDITANPRHHHLQNS
ncbi:hypothetical protein CPC08DRAFT_701929 [Agrocybe pediades]|nr:hypothetical protein CPC08DRAFT_701929 [Agrocybe pediades]